MSRPPKCRRIAERPPVAAFKPVGLPGRNLATIELSLDELEALRLADLEGLYHGPAAAGMGVSRPTFGRLLDRARHKVATALLQGKLLVIEGGPVQFQGTRSFACADCGRCETVACGGPRPVVCAGCGKKSIHRLDPARDCGCARAAGPCVHRRRGRCRSDGEVPGRVPSKEETP